ncbi:MAG: 3-isopropylmalate dehydratase small subunit [Alphaproteobacteria bacterium]
MDVFNVLEGVSAPFPMINVDTDVIIPKQFLKTIKRTGLGSVLFNDLRRDVDGNENEGFILNKPAYKETQILITGKNFGCGSSREHAPWALLDFGIRCVIAESFADIFYSNCFKNGILPIRLSEEEVKTLMQDAEVDENSVLKIDLEKQKITRSNGKKIAFEVDKFKKHCLLNGLDDIGLTLQKEEAITSFEIARKTTQPWL